MKIQNTFRRGFTLIELMIVIVILGILMGTILPRLTGAQARARDTARKADLSNISQALELYNSDKGSYPSAPGGVCLDPSTTSNESDPTKKIAYTLGTYMKGKKVPAAPSKKQKTLTKCQGQYYYQSLTSGGTSATSYILATSVETWQMGNLEVNTNDTVLKGGTTNNEANASTFALKKYDKKTTSKAYLYAVMP